MRLVRESILQIKSLAPIFAISYAILLGLLFTVVVISSLYEIPVAHFTRDPLATLHGHPFTGVISNIGILFWCSTFAVCLFSSAILYKKKTKEVAVFLLYSSLLTLLLLLDDLFMLHEKIIPRTLHVSQKSVYLGYLILTAIYFIKFFRLILRNEYTILFIACGFFALSVICDVFLPQKGMEYLVEDGFKLFGIVSWFIFFMRTCFSQVLQATDNWK